MLTKVIILTALLAVAYCHCYFKNVEVRAILTNGTPLVVNVTGCLERKSFLDGNKTRNVVEIDINKQNIPKLKEDNVRHLIHLRKITIRNTNLKTVELDVFRNVDKLEVIEFISNRIQTVKQGLFSFLNVRNVSFHDNMIETLDDMAFSHMNHLNNLNMSSNKIKTFKGTWFLGLPELISLDFRHNLIETLPQRAFANVANVTHIYLSHNNIANIEPNAFEGLNSLEDLELKYNLLKTLTPDSFPQNFKIDTLYINANRFNFLTTTLLEKISIRTISLDGNPLNCYCYLNMETVFEDKGVKIVSSQECLGLPVPVCVVAFMSHCIEDYDEKFTKYYYNQIPIQGNSFCTRPLK